MSNLLHDITKTAGRHKSRQRLGRGEGSKGKTSGRGQKGAGSRAGKNKRIGFEGGQSEVYRRFGFRGFSNKPFETKFHVVNIAQLERFEAGSTVDKASLKQAGLIPNTHLNVKILGEGKLTRKLTVVASAYSRSAAKAISDAGGEAQDANGQAYQFREPKNRRQAAKLDKRLSRLGLPPRPSKEEPEQTGKKGPKGEQKTGKKQKATTSDQDIAGGEVTEAPERGTKESAPSAARKPKKSSAPAEAHQSGEEE